MDKMLKEMRKWDRRMVEIWHAICGILEYMCVALVFIAVLVTFARLVPELGSVISGEEHMELTAFLEDVMLLAIGIEFMKLFAHPTMSHVLETIVFLVSRHMLVGESTPQQNLLSSVSIILLVMAYVAVRVFAKKNGEEVDAGADEWNLQADSEARPEERSEVRPEEKAAEAIVKKTAENKS